MFFPFQKENPRRHPHSFINHNSNSLSQIKLKPSSSSTFAFILILMMTTLPSPFLLLFFLSFSASVSANAGNVNPFTSRAATIRYWNRKVPNNAPHPDFLLSLLSPLPASASASLTALNITTSLCLSARLLCPNTTSFSSLSQSLSSHFSSYSSRNFTNYATSATKASSSSFSNYSPDQNIPLDTFRRYAHNTSFATYSSDANVATANVATANFTSYAASATGGSAGFSSYDDAANVPDLKFSSYADQANGLHQTFTKYSSDTNSGDQSFRSYAKNSNGVPSQFTSYANNSNVIGSTFNNYGETGNGATEGFTNYGSNGNGPQDNFRNYGSDSNAASDTFKSYREDANVGDDTFTSYDKDANAGSADFENYGSSFNPGSDTFKSYGQGSNPNHQITFKTYFQQDNVTFKDYSKTGVTFADYNKSMMNLDITAQKTTNKWVVEPGKFFRESELREGNEMPMPDIRDKMPVRSFLPRSIADRIPFEAEAVKSLFGLEQDSALAKAADDTVGDCKRPPSQGETKRCATSAEDMIDFAVEMLGNDIVVRSTESPNGSGGPIRIGKVKGINGGKVTRSVSCHQSLFPYMVYYCHSVPKVRVYVAEILAVETKEKINRGVAICHLDTSAWSPGHGAFVALGGKPGQIEVCHWIFNGDMTWAVADRS